MDNTKYITKRQYVNRKKKNYLEYIKTTGEMVDIAVLIGLIRQWEFDYEMEKLQ